MLRDKNIEWLRKHVWVPAAMCNKVISTNQVTTVAGGASLLELSTFAVDGFELNAAGEEVSATLLLPFDMDPDHALKFRIHFTGKSATAADTYTWKGFYNNAKSAAAIADPATAMSPDFSAVTLSGTAYRMGKTGWAWIAGGTWTRAEVEAGHILPVKFEIDASDASLASSEEVYFVGFEYSYVPQLTVGNGTERDLDAADASS